MTDFGNNIVQTFFLSQDTDEDSKKTDAVTEDDIVSDTANTKTSQSQDISSPKEGKEPNSEAKPSPDGEEEEEPIDEDDDDVDDGIETPADEDSEENQQENNASDETKVCF